MVEIAFFQYGMTGSRPGCHRCSRSPDHHRQQRPHHFPTGDQRLTTAVLEILFGPPQSDRALEGEFLTVVLDA
jgi:hypothetical protein